MDINELKSNLGTNLPNEFENVIGLLERFDPEKTLSLDRYYGNLKVEIISLPTDRKTFLFDLRKISNLSISELMGKLKTLPFTILEEMCTFRNSVNLNNLPEHLAINLISLKEIYPNNLKISFKEKCVEDCPDYGKYPKFTQSVIPQTSDIIELN